MSKHRRAAAAVLVGLCGASAACRTPGIDAAKNAQAVSMRVPGARAAAREDAVSQAQAPPAQTKTPTQPGGKQTPAAARGGGPGVADEGVSGLGRRGSGAPDRRGRSSRRGVPTPSDALDPTGTLPPSAPNAVRPGGR